VVGIYLYLHAVGEGVTTSSCDLSLARKWRETKRSNIKLSLKIIAEKIRHHRHFLADPGLMLPPKRRSLLAGTLMMIWMRL